jgi:hypothetical protein
VSSAQKLTLKLRRLWCIRSDDLGRNKLLKLKGG